MVESWVTQLRRGMLELCILCFLDKGESYGYEIVHELSRIEDLVVSESTVYPILSRLRKEGLLKVRAVPSPSGPPRKYFSLSAAGGKYYADISKRWSSIQASVEALQNLSKETT